MLKKIQSNIKRGVYEDFSTKKETKTRKHKKKTGHIKRKENKINKTTDKVQERKPLKNHGSSNAILTP